MRCCVCLQRLNYYNGRNGWAGFFKNKLLPDSPLFLTCHAKCKTTITAIISLLRVVCVYHDNEIMLPDPSHSTQAENLRLILKKKNLKVVWNRLLDFPSVTVKNYQFERIQFVFVSSLTCKVYTNMCTFNRWRDNGLIMWPARSAGLMPLITLRFITANVFIIRREDYKITTDTRLDPEKIIYEFSEQFLISEFDLQQNFSFMIPQNTIQSR